MQIEVGSVLGCWFPEEGLVPGPKFRPVVVLDVVQNEETGRQELLVAYGTSQHTRCPLSHEFTATAAERSGWTGFNEKDTMFNLKCLRNLPLVSKYFGSPKIVGNVTTNKSLRCKFAIAAHEAGLV